VSPARTKRKKKNIYILITGGFNSNIRLKCCIPIKNKKYNFVNKIELLSMADAILGGREKLKRVYPY
jgi:hypothetical protein